MRTMTYRIELSQEDGYVISNSNASWEEAPGQESFIRPPIKLSNAPLENGQIVANIEDYIEFDDDIDLVDASLRESYIRALHGAMDEWRLIAVSVKRVGVTLLLANSLTHSVEFMSIRPAPYLRAWFDIQQEDGRIDRVFIGDVGSQRRTARFVYHGV